MLTSIEIHNFKAIKDGQDENGNITEKPLILKDLTNVNYLGILCCEQESFYLLLNRKTTQLKLWMSNFLFKLSSFYLLKT